jgi:hypothetical protein
VLREVRKITGIFYAIGPSKGRRRTGLQAIAMGNRLEGMAIPTVDRIPAKIREI